MSIYTHRYLSPLLSTSNFTISTISLEINETFIQKFHPETYNTRNNLKTNNLNEKPYS